MIQPINYNAPSPPEPQSIKGVTQEYTQGVTEDCRKQEILNIYNEDLSVGLPTYSDDIKELMKSANIEESSLNAEVVKTMDKYGIEVSKDTLNIIVNQLQEEHLFQLYKEGYNIDELTVDIIAKEIMLRGHIPMAEDQDDTSSLVDQDIVQTLMQAGLPLTNRNVETLIKYREKVESVISASDITIKNMLRYDLDITINNLYTAKHSGLSKDTNRVATEQQIIAVLDANEIEITSETIQVVKKLIESGIEVTKINVEKYIQVQNILKHLDRDELMINAAKAMANGQNPGDMEVYNGKVSTTIELTYDEIKQIVEDIQHFDEAVIENIYKQNKPITIGNLQQTLYENVEKVLGKEKTESTLESENKESGNLDLTEQGKIDLTKRQIEEIRLKLTVEAALKLNNKLNIQTTDLQRVVEELKVLEEESCKEVLSNMKASVTEENIEHMQKTREQIYNITQNKELAAVQVVEGDAIFTLEGMDEAIKAKRAQEVYDDIGTKPEGRFGESIAKVENQLEHILNLQEIEATSSNIKAAKALAQNNVEITKQHIEETKVVLLKIETLLYELRPAVVAQLLRDGIRPDTIHVDDLIQYVKEKHRDGGQDPTQKVAEAILELDNTNQLKAEEKEGLIAVYRMLNTITKNDTAAIGFLLKNNKDLTLGNLFEASKYLKQVGNKAGKMDVEVNDSLGVREGELPTNIRSLIEGAVKASAIEENKNIHLNNKDILEQWLSRITPEELKKYIDSNKPLEEIDVQQGKLSSLDLERTTKQIGALEKISPTTLTFLKEQNIPLTISNIYWADKIIKNPFLLGDMLREYENLVGEKIKSSIHNKDNQDVGQVLDSLQEELKGQTPIQLSATQNTVAYTIGKELDQMINMQKQIASNDGIYQIPVELHHGTSNLNIYVMKDKEHTTKSEKEELRAYMSIKTKNLGIIQIHMGIQDKGLSFEMIGETPNITSKLKQSSNELSKAIKDIGYNVLQAKFSQGEFKNPIINKPKTQVPFARNKVTDAAFEHIV